MRVCPSYGIQPVLSTRFKSLNLKAMITTGSILRMCTPLLALVLSQNRTALVWVPFLEEVWRGGLAVRAFPTPSPPPTKGAVLRAVS